MIIRIICRELIASAVAFIYLSNYYLQYNKLNSSVATVPILFYNESIKYYTASSRHHHRHPEEVFIWIDYR
jgi:hypothetical protein